MKVKYIGLALNHTLDFYRDVLRGIREYGLEKPSWIFVPIQPDARSIKSRRTARCAGFIGHVSTLSLAKAMERTQLPWVNVSSVHPDMPFPRVMVDHVAVGRLAARYFLDRGFRSFAYVGYRNHLFSMQREQGYRHEIEAADGQLCSVFEEMTRHADPTGVQYSSAALNEWLVRLPKPIAAFTSNDVQGFHVAEACRECGIQVPEQLAIISVDNDDLLCDLAQPPLASVALPTRRIGYEAARMLDRMLRGRKPPRRPKLLPPVGIVERASSNILAIDDQLVAQALQYIRTNAHRAIDVVDVAREVSVSRRRLERAFRRVLHRTVAEEVRRAHLAIAYRLLTQTKMNMSEIAKAAGFSDGKHFATVFRRLEGTTPTAYRSQRSRV